MDSKTTRDRRVPEGHSAVLLLLRTESSGDSTEEEQYPYSLTKSYVTTVGSYSGPGRASNYTGTGACPAHIALPTSDDEGRGSPLESGLEINFFLKFGP